MELIAIRARCASPSGDWDCELSERFRLLHSLEEVEKIRVVVLLRGSEGKLIRGFAQPERERHPPAFLDGVNATEPYGLGGEAEFIEVKRRAKIGLKALSLVLGAVEVANGAGEVAIGTSDAKDLAESGGNVGGIHEHLFGRGECDGGIRKRNVIDRGERKVEVLSTLRCTGKHTAERELGVGDIDGVVDRAAGKEAAKAEITRTDFEEWISWRHMITHPSAEDSFKKPCDKPLIGEGDERPCKAFEAKLPGGVGTNADLLIHSGGRGNHGREIGRRLQREGVVRKRASVDPFKSSHRKQDR